MDTSENGPILLVLSPASEYVMRLGFCAMQLLHWGGCRTECDAFEGRTTLLREDRSFWFASEDGKEGALNMKVGHTLSCFIFLSE